MRILKSSAALAAFLILLPLAVIHNTALAASGITVSPAYDTLHLVKGAGSTTTKLSITNSYNVPIALQAEFRGMNQSGGNLTPAATLPNSLKGALSISNDKFTVEPGSTTTLTVTLSSTQSLPPGGSYASLVIGQQPRPDQSVSVQAAVSVTLFLIKDAGAIAQLQASDLDDIPSIAFKWPQVVSMQLKNTGNIAVVPRGSTTIERSNKVFSKGLINDSSFTFFPNDALRLQSKLTRISRAFIPGRYDVVIRTRPDATVTQESIIRKSFIYVPIWFPIVVLIHIYLFYRITRFIRRFSRKTIRRKPNRRTTKSTERGKNATIKPLNTNNKSLPKRLHINDKSEANIVIVKTKKQ